MRLRILIFLLMLCGYFGYAQSTLKISTSQAISGEVQLVGFNGFVQKTLTNQELNAAKEITLSIPDSYVGAAILDVKNQGNLLLLLNDEDILVRIENIKDLSTIQYSKSQENTLLAQYREEQGKRNAKLSGLKYLLPLYSSQSEKLGHDFVAGEIQKLEEEEEAFLSKLPANSYVKYYIPLRNLIAERPNAVQRYPERIPEHIAAFYELNLQDSRLLNSGLLEQFYEGHFLMLKQLASQGDVTKEYYKSIDHIITSLKDDSALLLDVAAYLIKLFDERDLYEAAEYLSLKMLNQPGVVVEGDLENRMEQYREMKPGNIAANIEFEKSIDGIKSLNEIETKYKLIFFWSPGCGGCKEAIPDLKEKYSFLKSKDVEVLAISLSKKESEYQAAIKDFPWLNYCDFEGWDGQAVQDYFVFGTPAFFLLDQNNKILLKPGSISQLESYINYVF